MVGKNSSILIVDDDPTVSDLLYEELSERGCRCSTVLDGTAALAQLATQDFDVVLLDIRLPGVSGMEVLKIMQTTYPNTTAIMVTAVNNIDVAVEAIKLGASDYIVKPFDLERVHGSIRMASKAKQDSCGRRDDKTPLSVEYEENQSRVDKWIRCIDAIARGVEARLDEHLGYSATVSRETIHVARQLDIRQKQIKRWVTMRSERNVKRNARIKSALDKLQRSPLAQSIMGIAVPYVYSPKLDELES